MKATINDSSAGFIPFSITIEVQTWEEQHALAMLCHHSATVPDAMRRPGNARRMRLADCVGRLLANLWKEMVKHKRHEGWY